MSTKDGLDQTVSRDAGYRRDLGTDKWCEFEDRDFSDWKRVRSAIEHENNLVNHRLTWLLLAQGGLFTLFSSLSSIDEIFIRVCVAFFGMIFCLFMYIPLREADKALESLHVWWHNRIFAQPELIETPPTDPAQTNRLAVVL